MDCGNVLEDLGNFIDQRLSLSSQQALLAHCHDCPICHEYVQVYRSMVELPQQPWFESACGL